MRLLPTISQLLLSLALALTVTACSDSSTPGNETKAVVTEIPEAIQKFTLTTTGTLLAWAIVDGGTPVAMNINTVAGTASVTITDLSRASHTVQIIYEYNIGGTLYTLATASNTVDLSSGSGSLNFASGDFDTASHDSDGDGISNADEVAAGTDPGDGACVLGTSLLGSCTLG